MSDTANFGQTLLETVRSLPPTQQEAVLNFARSLSDPKRDRTEAAQKMLLDLEKIQTHHGEPTVAVYVESLLRTIREIRDRHPNDPYTEIAIALHDAIAVRNQWASYSVEQYKSAYSILKSLIQSETLSDEAVEDAILSLDNLGFEVLPLTMISTIDEEG